MALADRGMQLGLRALNGFAGMDVLDRIGMRDRAERFLHGASKQSVRTAGTVGRTFNGVAKRGKPARPSTAPSRNLFDLTPSDEQQMLRESFAAFAAEKLRPAAHAADAESKAPDELMAQASELGITMLGVPEELGGAVDERSAVTSVLVAEALAHGDMGLAFAALAPAGVATAISLWGDAEQQSKYLPELVGDDPPAAALATLEPRPLFDPMHLQTKAAADNTLSGVKALVPRAAEAELFVVSAERDGNGPGLFIVESKAEGVFVEPEPAMGLRAAATAKLILDGAAGTPIESADYAESVHRARLGWCALAVGTAQAVLDYVIPYVNERVAFGEPVSHRQAVAFAVSNMAIELEGMRLATYRAAARADQGKDFAHATTLARQLCSEKGMQIGSDGVQLLGGHGFVKEHPVERWYRDLRAAGLMEGALLV
jgi:alkylation response protein AidB-like acyl-CoA dehydrogenase